MALQVFLDKYLYKNRFSKYFKNIYIVWCPWCFANSFLFFKVLLFLLFDWLGNNSKIVNIIFMEKYAI